MKVQAKRTVLRKPDGRKSKTKKSIMTKLIPGTSKTNKTYGIYTVSNGKTLYVRLISSYGDDTGVTYNIRFVTKMEDCSKFISVESVRRGIESIKRKLGRNLELKVIQCTKTK